MEVIHLRFHLASHALGAVHKLRWQDFGVFLTTYPGLCWHFLWDERWQKVIHLRFHLALHALAWEAVHKVHQHFFFAIFDTPVSHINTFLYLSIRLFSQFLTPPLLKSADVLYGWPLSCVQCMSGLVTNKHLFWTCLHLSFMVSKSERKKIVFR